MTGAARTSRQASKIADISCPRDGARTGFEVDVNHNAGRLWSVVDLMHLILATSTPTGTDELHGVMMRPGGMDGPVVVTPAASQAKPLAAITNATTPWLGSVPTT